jgi:hypothetical protein
MKDLLGHLLDADDSEFKFPERFAIHAGTTYGMMRAVGTRQYRRLRVYERPPQTGSSSALT